MNKDPLREITDEDIKTFWRDGVVCVRGVLDQDWIERMREAMERVLENPSYQGINYNPEGSPGRMFYENHMWTRDEDFKAFVFESPLAQISSKILRSEKINIIYDFILTKEPHSPYPTDWHQDENANPLEGRQCGGNWIPLDDVTLESGALQYVKGSHEWGVFSNGAYELEAVGENPYFRGYEGEEEDPTRSPDVHELLPDIEAKRDEYDIVQFDTSPGDIILNHLRSIHYAPGNFTDTRRRAIGHRWAGDDATYARRTHSLRILPPFDPAIKNGDSFPIGDHSLYPRVWPRLNGASSIRAAN